jgi:hypothetical protein
MKTENKFYIAKSISADSGLITISPDYSYDLSTGELIEQSGSSVIVKHSVNNADRISIEIPISLTAIHILKWDASDRYLGYKTLYSNVWGTDDSVVYDEVNEIYKIDLEIQKDTKQIGFVFDSTSISRYVNVTEKRCFEINPHYKQIKKKYKKETSQVFFRESLDGRINLFGTDYVLIKNSSLEETLYFYVYRHDKLYASATFNKSDCKFDDAKSSVELKLTYNDKYTKILDAYENTYDLIKLAPVLTPITLTKRCVIQIYVQGEKVLSNYAGGTYWETDVDEPIDDENALTRKYYFAKGPKFVEIDLENFNYNINAAYRCLSDNNSWNGTSKHGNSKSECCIYFRKIADAGDIYHGVGEQVKLLSTGAGNGTHEEQGPLSTVYQVYTYDTYKIEIYNGGHNGEGTKVYESDYYYGKDDTFLITAGNGLYPMHAVSQTPPATQPLPETFYLSENVIEYQIWGRLLCDADKVSDTREGHEGEYIDTYDLPRDDFATPRRNYRKCIGLIGFDKPNAVISIWQNGNVSESPTSYGITDFGDYFIPPYTPWGQYFYPLARSSWANVSMWTMLGTSYGGYAPFEQFCSDCYVEYTIKDVCHIGDAIKAILAKIDPSIKHEKTAEYSSFLYEHSGGTASALGNCDIYITQKTNILKGEYDQAAQKAEIKFKQLMDMLRDCFRCYWFIDEQNRFRIEHISYFMNGLSYNVPTVQLDLTNKKDKFNKKLSLYGQQNTEYDKADLISRYEFKYMDDVTKAMGGDLYIDVNNTYITKDKTEEINIDGFVADIDYMLFLPDDFSNDGFALIMADANKKVPMVSETIKDEKQYNHSFGVTVQNWYASFNQLAWHYMEDISGRSLSYNNVEYLYPGHIKRCMKYNIEISTDNIDIYKLIRTDKGNGYIEELSTDIDTDISDIELRYEPS